MIAREKYLEKLINARNNGFPKVITGCRRCGKSYLVKEIFKKCLINNGLEEENFLTIELDDIRNIEYRDPIYLAKYIQEYCSNKKECVVFIDEIQMVYSIINPNLTEGKHVLAKKDDKGAITFVNVVLGLSREKNIDLYISGSNSKMLSTDIITEFRDKATNIQMFPLSFEEFYNYKKGSKLEALYEYMQYGGMPLAVLKNTDEKKEYLKSLFETTYFKDIIERNSLRKSSTLDELSNILASEVGQLINSKKLADTYKSIKHENIDKETVDRYINFFVESFLLQEVRRYDLKGRKEIGALKKYYFVDTGLRNACLDFTFDDEGQMLENVIYNELIYKGYSVSVGTFDNVSKNKDGKSVRKTNEIDFYAKKGIHQYYIQVSLDISDAKTKAREFHPFLMINDEVKKVLVVSKPISETLDENGFTIIGVSDFMLNFI